MAVISHELHWNGATGHRSPKDREYTAIYRVITDDAHDQAQVVVDWFLANVKPFYSIYAYANDYDPRAYMQKIQPTRDLNSHDVWTIQLTYSPLEPDENEDEEGNPTENPLDWRPRITRSSNQYTRPVERAIYRFGLTGAAAGLMLDGDEYIPCNSAFVPFNPGLEMDESRSVITIQRNLPTWNDDVNVYFENRINSQPFRIAKFGFTLTVPLRAARIRSQSSAFRTVTINVGDTPTRIDYWESSGSFEVTNSPHGWVDEVVDRGVLARACDGDPDGRGGTVSGQNGGMIAGVPHERRLVDMDETPISDPVLLDGNGQPLEIDCDILQEPVYLGWQKYQEKDFRSWPLLAGLTSDV